MPITEPTNEISPSSSIHLLPEHLVDQIKAGEVIERPASLIKEILENSLDAGSTKVDIHIVANGMDLISLTDNGSGMTYADLPYAFCRHATSKIDRFEDLYKLNSYGFRGEALASIGAVARVTLTSSPQDNSPLGGKIIFNGGECLAHDQQNNLPKGTSLFIKDLFYNTPARLKFIKSNQSEKNAIKRILEAYLLAHPQVDFSIKWDDADKEFYSATTHLEDRVKQVLCKKVKDKNLFFIDAHYEGHRVWGYFTKASSRGHAHKKQYLFANKRIFTDRQIHQTIIRNLEKVYPIGESGHYCLFLQVPENLIDVNVHPSKTQIKFFKLPVLTALISTELKKLANQQDHQQAGFSFSQDSTPGFSSTSQTFGHKQGQENGFNHQTPHSFHGSYSAALTSNGLRPFDDQNNEGLTSSRSSLVKSDHDLVCLTLEDRPVILSHKKLLNFLFQSNAHTHQEANFIPLLISEPIIYSGDQEHDRTMFTDLESKGFLCERLDDTTLALRAIHKDLDLIEEPAEVIKWLVSGQNPEGEKNPPLFSIKKEALKKLLLSIDRHERSKFLIEIDESFYAAHFND